MSLDIFDKFVVAIRSLLCRTWKCYVLANCFVLPSCNKHSKLSYINIFPSLVHIKSQYGQYSLCHVCVCLSLHPWEGGLFLSGDAWDPEWGMDFIFFIWYFSNLNWSQNLKFGALIDHLSSSCLFGGQKVTKLFKIVLLTPNFTRHGACRLSRRRGT